MNEHENTKLVQQAYRSIGEGNLQFFLDSLAEDVYWQLPEMENVPFAGTWKGRDEVARFFNTISEVQDAVEFEPEEYIAQGDKVIALGHFTMRIKATGGEYSSDWAHVWTISDGQVTRYREYVDTAVVSSAHSAARTSAKRG